MMLLARRSVVALASAAFMTLLLTGGYPLGAQESGAAKSQASKAKQATKTDSPVPSDTSTITKSTGKVAPPDPTHRVPPGYAKLGLSDEQKEALYKIQAKYYQRIQDLEKQATALRARREAEFEAVLKPAQKRQLAEQEKQRKAAAAAKKAAAIKAAEKEREKS
jgi:hypothetical protein